MSVDLTRGIVRILHPDGSTAGTGFVVSADGLIATCSHVVQSLQSQKAEEPRPEKVTLIFHANGMKTTAHVVPGWWRACDVEDVAILRLEETLCAPIKPLILGNSSGSDDHAVRTYGFPSKKSIDGLPGVGRVIPGGTKEGGCPVIVISSTQITIGFSGGPIFDAQTRRVIGMVTSILPPDEYRRPVDIASATPTETLREICEKLQLSDVCPYMSLEAFTEDSDEFFVGRKDAVSGLVQKLKSHSRFLAVLGPSGSGKSSLVRAGLIPGLRKGQLPGSEHWGFVIARPADQPFGQLATQGLPDAAKGLTESVQRWIAEHTKNTRLVLVIDQLEDLFVSCSEAERSSFVEQLISLLNARSLAVSVLLIMRDDFYSRLAHETPNLLPCIEDGLVNVPTLLKDDEIKEIITAPAVGVGIEVEEALVAVITQDVLEAAPDKRSEVKGAVSTVLPLLEFALTLLWERRQAVGLTCQSYIAAGGLTGALSLWADQAYNDLKEADHALAQRIFTDLVHVKAGSQGASDSRIRKPLGSLWRAHDEQEAVHRIVWHFADARLLVTYRDERSQETVEIIHDALIREWKTLQQWLNEDRRFLLWRQQIEAMEEIWAASKCDQSDLLRGRALAEAENWLNERQVGIGPLVQKYVEASIDLRENDRQAREQECVRVEQERVRVEQERTSTRQRIMKGSLVFSAFALLLAIFAGWQSQNAKYEAQIADQQRRISLSRQLAAQAEVIYVQQPYLLERGVLLAVEAMRRNPAWEANKALMDGIALLPKTLWVKLYNRGISNIEFSPDGRFIAVGDKDGNAHIVAVDTGREVAHLTQEIGLPLHNIAFNSHGDYFATASSSLIRIWDTHNWTLKREFHPPHRIRTIAWSPTEDVMAAISENGRATLWIPTQDKPHADLQYPKATPAHSSNYSYDLLYHACFSPDGRYLATANISGIDVLVWDWKRNTSQPCMQLKHRKTVVAMTFSPDSLQVATISEDFDGEFSSTQIWRLRGQPHIQYVESNPTFRIRHDRAEFDTDYSPKKSLAYSKDGMLLATAGQDGTVRVLDVRKKQEIARIQHMRCVNDICFSPDGNRNYIATACQACTAHVWRAETGRELARVAYYPYSGSGGQVAFSPDGRYIASAHEDTLRICEAYGGAIPPISLDDKTMSLNGRSGIQISTHGDYLIANIYNKYRLWDVNNDRPVVLARSNETYSSIAMSQDGRHVAVVTEAGVASLWDRSQNAGLSNYPTFTRQRAKSVSISSTGSSLAVIDQNSRRIFINTGMLHSQIIIIPKNITYTMFSPTGRYLIAKDEEQHIHVWDIHTDPPVEKLQLIDKTSTFVISPDEQFLYSVTESGSLKVWEITTGRIVQALDLQLSQTIGAFALSADGRYVVGETANHVLHIWDTTSRAEIAQLHQDVSCLSKCFSPDGRYLATGNVDKVLQLWDIQTGREIARINYPADIQNICFSADGKYLCVSAGKMVYIQLWQSAHLIAEAALRLSRNLEYREWSQYLPGEPYMRTFKNLPDPPSR